MRPKVEYIRYTSKEENERREHIMVELSKQSTLPLTLKIVDNNEFPIQFVYEIANPLLLILENGKYAILPSNIRGVNIKKMMGLKLTKVRGWALLPGARSKSALYVKNSGTLSSPGKDLYDEI